jgi:hypothetical protein
MLGVLLTGHLSFVVLCWLVMLGGVAVIITAIALGPGPDRSIWHYAATQVPRWFALGLAVDAITTYLRLHLAHGRTRRDFLRQLMPYLVVLPVVMAVLVALGYLAERGTYSLAGWSQNIPDHVLFGATSDFFGLASAFSLQLLLWTVAGALLAAAFTRSTGLGLVSIPVAFGMVALSELLVGVKSVPFFRDVSASWRLDLGLSLSLTLGAAVLGAALTWGIVRDIPLRPRVT